MAIIAHEIPQLMVRCEEKSVLVGIEEMNYRHVFFGRSWSCRLKNQRWRLTDREPVYTAAKYSLVLAVGDREPIFNNLN